MTSETPAPAAPSQWRRKAIAALVVALGLASVAWGVKHWRDQLPPPLPSTPQEAMDFLASPRFASLSSDRKQDYVQHSMELMEKLKPEEKAAIREDWRKKMQENPELEKNTRDAREQMLYARAAKYVHATPEQQKQMVDEVVTGMRMMGAMGAMRGPGGPGSGPGGGQAPDPAREAERQQRRADMQARIQDRIQHGNPQQQAYVAEFFKAVAKERKEQGLDPMPRPPFAPPGR